MDYRLEDLIDIPRFQALQDSLDTLLSFPSAIIDPDGNVLTATAWQDVCTEFHRTHPVSAAQCRQSDRYIREHLEEGAPTVTYECPHGLVDNATPIIIDGAHLGNLFTGQFFLEPPNLERFRLQARQYGFDEEAYLGAVSRVPVWSRERLKTYLQVMRRFTEILGEIGLQRLRHLQGEQRFRVIFEQSALGIAVTAMDGRHLDCNPALLRMLGLTREEFLANRTEDFTHPDDLNPDRTPWRELQEGERGSYQREVRYLRKDGDVVWARITVSRCQYGADAQDAVLAIVEDITDRRRALEALAQEADLRERLLENLPCVALVLKKGTREIVFSNVFARELGAELGATCFASCAQRDAPCPFCLAPETWATDEPRFVEAEYGGRFYEGRWLPLNDELYVHFVFDITDRKLAEVEKQRLEAQLQRSQRLESIGVLAGGIAHDFNNVLAGISGFSELSLAELEPGTPVTENLTRILEATQRAQELVRQILAFCRQAPMERKPASMQSIVEDALGFARASLPATVEIEAALTPEGLTVYADVTQVQQVILNICANAEHAMRPQGGVLGVRLEAADLDAAQAQALGAPGPGRYAMLALSDTGCGMDAATRERVFDPFFTTKPAGEGTGLGLSTSYGIVASHGGAIAVESEPGRGTTFRVYLPLTEAPVEEAPPAAAAPTLGTGRILFVDDEVALRAIGQRMLERLGFEATVVSSGQEALDSLRAEPEGFRAVVTDQTMPGMTGLAFVAEARQGGATLPVLMATGFSGDVTPERLAHLGIQEVLSKPYTLQELSAALQRALGPGVS
jgi:PAS domain S-box-containing protein